MRIIFTEKLNKMVPQSKNLLLMGQKALGTIKLGSEMTMIIEIRHLLWLNSSWNSKEESSQNLDLLAEKALLAGQRQYQCGWINDINTNNQPIWSSIVRACSYKYYLMKKNKKIAGEQDTDKPLFWEKGF